MQLQITRDVSNALPPYSARAPTDNKNTSITPFTSALYRNLHLTPILSNMSPQRECFIPTAGVLRPHSGTVLSPQRECFVSTAGVFCPHGKTVASPQLECYPKGVKKARLRVTQKNEGILGALILLLVLRRVDRGAARIRITFCPKCFRLTGAPGTKERRIYTKYQVYIYIYIPSTYSYHISAKMLRIDGGSWH